MYKKLIAMIMVCAMLVSISPAVAAEDAPVKPSVEEILNDYHQKAFESQNSEKLGTATTNTNRSGAKTLEQETVDTLNAAGYEAYNVTASNYDTLEAQLNTDFASLGLDPDCSYIVVISGEESENTNGARGYGDNLITPSPWPDDGGDGNLFSYTYEGTTYTMRYLTITADDDPAYAKADFYNCLHSNALDNIENSLNAIIFVSADYILNTFAPIYLGTIASICGLSLVDFGTASHSTLILNGGASWTRTYTQVWNGYYESWANGSCVEYVETLSFVSGMYYDRTLNRMKSVPNDESEATLYSEHYYDMTWRKEEAAKSYYHATTYDVVGPVKFKYNGNDVITLLENF